MKEYKLKNEALEVCGCFLIEDDDMIEIRNENFYFGLCVSCSNSTGFVLRGRVFVEMKHKWRNCSRHMLTNPMSD